MNNTWNSYLKPVAVLLAICAAVGALLSGVNALTASAIAANEEAQSNAAYFSALPEADSFTAVECSIEGVTAVLKAENGAGYVITAQARGYGGQVPAVVAFSPEGTILSVVMMSNDETPGLGQKVTASDFTGQFSGRGAEPFTIDDVDAISGATISSKATVSAVNLAIDAFQQVTGGMGA